MRTRTLELQLRKKVSRVIEGHAVWTWHEDRQVSPGVPDASYVMNAGDYETGWLELKATVVGDPVEFELQPAQHDWMTRHAWRIPAHFLCAVGSTWFIIHGDRHEALSKPIQMRDLKAIALTFFPEDRAREYLPLFLRDATWRGRNAR